MRGLEALFSGLATGYKSYSEAKRKSEIQDSYRKNLELKNRQIDNQSKALAMQVQMQAMQLDAYKKAEEVKKVDGVWRRFLTDNSFDALNEQLKLNKDIRGHFGNATRFEKLSEVDYDKLAKEGKNVEFMKKQDPNRYARKWYQDPETGMMEYKLVDLHAIRKGIGFYRRDLVGKKLSNKNSKLNDNERYIDYTNTISKRGINSLDAGERADYQYLNKKFNDESEFDQYRRIITTNIKDLTPKDRASLPYLKKKYDPVEKQADDPYYFAKLEAQHKAGGYNGLDFKTGETLFWQQVDTLPAAAAKRYYTEEWITHKPRFAKSIKENKLINDKDLVQLQALEYKADIHMPNALSSQITTGVNTVKEVRALQDELISKRNILKDSNDIFAAMKTWVEKQMSDTEWEKKSAKERVRTLAQIEVKTSAGMIISQYLKLVSGTAVPDSEYERIIGFFQAGKNVNYEMLYTAINKFGQNMKGQVKGLIDGSADEYVYKTALANNALIQTGDFKPLDMKAQSGEEPSTVTKATNAVLDTASNIAGSTGANAGADVQDKSDKVRSIMSNFNEGQTTTTADVNGTTPSGTVVPDDKVDSILDNIGGAANNVDVPYSQKGFAARWQDKKLDIPTMAMAGLIAYRTDKAAEAAMNATIARLSGKAKTEAEVRMKEILNVMKGRNK